MIVLELLYASDINYGKIKHQMVLYSTMTGSMGFATFHLCPSTGTFHRSASSEMMSAATWIPRKALLFLEDKAISSFRDLKVRKLSSYYAYWS